MNSETRQFWGEKSFGASMRWDFSPTHIRISLFCKTALFSHPTLNNRMLLLSETTKKNTIGSSRTVVVHHVFNDFSREQTSSCVFNCLGLIFKISAISTTGGTTFIFNRNAVTDSDAALHCGTFNWSSGEASGGEGSGHLFSRCWKGSKI